MRPTLSTGLTDSNVPESDFGNRSDHIGVSASDFPIAPGTTESEGTTDLNLFEGEGGKKAIASTPLGRLGTPDDIARVVGFLASDDAAWVTGEVIRAAGGAK